MAIIHTHISTNNYAYIHTYTCIHIYISCIHARIPKYIYAYTYTFIHCHKYTCTHLFITPISLMHTHAVIQKAKII